MLLHHLGYYAIYHHFLLHIDMIHHMDYHRDSDLHGLHDSNLLLQKERNLYREHILVFLAFLYLDDFYSFLVLCFLLFLSFQRDMEG